jgi:YD repeat-containing protein
VTNATYTALDQPVRRDSGNGAYQTWQYENPTQRLSQLEVRGNPSAIYLSYVYSYDKVGNLTSLDDGIVGNTLTYDARNRLLSATRPAETFAYDELGNLTSKTGIGAYQYGANLNGTGAGPHQARTVNGQAYSYDANGNLLSGGGRTYLWNNERLLQSVTNGTTTEQYTYDADGERVTRSTGANSFVYLEGLWEEAPGESHRAIHYACNGEIVAQRDGANQVVFLHQDHLGSVGAVSRRSASGTAEFVEGQRFRSWGTRWET